MNSVIKGVESTVERQKWFRISENQIGKTQKNVQGTENWHSYLFTSSDVITAITVRMLFIHLLFHKYLLHVRGSDIQ